MSNAPIRMKSHVVIVARRYDIPYSGIVECDGSFWLFDRERSRNDDDYFLLFPVSRSSVEQLVNRVVPSVRHVDALIDSKAIVSPLLLGMPVDDAYRRTWNAFVDTLPEAVQRAYWASVEIDVSEVRVNTPEVSKPATSVAMTFLVQDVKDAAIPKMNMLLPLASDAKDDLPFVSPDNSQEMLF
ncbi:MAG: hypothetical protein U0840_09605 [Gemmataceae bacterium]